MSSRSSARRSVRLSRLWLRCLLAYLFCQPRFRFCLTRGPRLLGRCRPYLARWPVRAGANHGPSPGVRVRACTADVLESESAVSELRPLLEQIFPRLSNDVPLALLVDLVLDRAESPTSVPEARYRNLVKTLQRADAETLKLVASKVRRAVNRRVGYAAWMKSKSFNLNESEDVALDEIMSMNGTSLRLTARRHGLKVPLDHLPDEEVREMLVHLHGDRFASKVADKGLMLHMETGVLHMGKGDSSGRTRCGRCIFHNSKRRCVPLSKELGPSMCKCSRCFRTAADGDDDPATMQLRGQAVTHGSGENQKHVNVTCLGMDVEPSVLTVVAKSKAVLSRSYDCESPLLERHWLIVDVFDELRAATGQLRQVREACKGTGRHASFGEDRLAELELRKTELERVLAFMAASIHVTARDVNFEFTRSGGKGGQNVNKVETAVRAIHVPTGVSVRCDVERSQLANKKGALRTLQSKLDDMWTGYSVQMRAKRGEAQTAEERSSALRPYADSLIGMLRGRRQMRMREVRLAMEQKPQFNEALKSVRLRAVRDFVKLFPEFVVRGKGPNTLVHL
mmetsp:Transcript_108789/g.306570  ORF Transcript_108789/g.306570 Transcript_108789/m.306570 type:complete len:567 (-) Transcript_108789:202-1902(-)